MSRVAGSGGDKDGSVGICHTYLGTAEQEAITPWPTTMHKASLLYAYPQHVATLFRPPPFRLLWAPLQQQLARLPIWVLRRRLLLFPASRIATSFENRFFFSPAAPASLA